MATDISREIEHAFSSAASWNASSVREALAFFGSSTPNSQIDWDEGEEWGRVVQDNLHVAIVCARLPLVIAHASLRHVAHGLIKTHGVTVLITSDFDKKTFSVDRALLERVFEREISSNISCEQLSMNDLWWATV